MSSYIENLREKEYPNLSNNTYLDHAGMTLYSKTLIENSSKILMSNLLSNPHSLSALSKSTELIIKQTRLKILKLFQADPAIYDIAFTQNSTAAIKILAESIRDKTNGNFKYYYNLNSHTSLIGVRNLCNNESDFSKFENIDEITNLLKKNNSDNSNSNSNLKLKLISWTGQSNFNGERFPMNSWHTIFKSFDESDLCNDDNDDNDQGKGEVYTLFDASSLATTTPPNLSNPITSPDFICVSFYKMFGYPDLGGLIYKKSEGCKLFPYRKYFGGGTVDALSADNSFVAKRLSLFETIEDGTLPIHSILQLSEAIDCHDNLYGNFNNISKYTKNLVTYCYRALMNLKYDNGQKMVEIYSSVGKSESDCNHDSDLSYGPIVAFSILDENLNHLGYYNFEKFASAQNISLRTGTVCNIGGVCKWLNRDSKDIENDYKMGHKCGDHMDIINHKPTGIIRVSFGAMSILKDIFELVNCIKEFTKNSNMNNLINNNRNSIFMKSNNNNQILESNSIFNSNKLVKIKEIIIYPIKSCHGFVIPKGIKWVIKPYGLKYDREFVLIDITNNKPLNLKDFKKMVYVKPSIDFTKDEMTIENGSNSSTLNNDKLIIKNISNISSCYNMSTLTSPDGSKFYECILDKEIREFLSNIVGTPCTLGRLKTQKLNSVYDSINKSSNKMINRIEDEDLDIVARNSMQNKSAFLLISEKSLEQLQQETKIGDNNEDIKSRFRGNIVIEGDSLIPFEEDYWDKISVNGKDIVLKTIDKCERCHMVTIDQESGKIDGKFYINLAKKRKQNGKVFFGSNLNLDVSCWLNRNKKTNGVSNEMSISVNDNLQILSFK
ncbi:catalytic activity protein [[Candida] boidinii]|nr:catalytic activity protein [[Candida] boidinii]